MADSLAADARFPHVPDICKIKADPACSGCPMASAAGHETVSEISPEPPIPAASRFDGRVISGWQWMLKRMGIDSDGVPGAYNDAIIDSWYPYNAKGSVNYADSMGFTVSAVSGTQITLKTLDSSDAASRGLFGRMVPNPDYGSAAGLPRLLEESYSGCVQPGMVIQFSGNSVLTYTCWPVIVGIVSCAGDTLVVECDKAATAALTKYEIDDGAGGTMPDPSDVTCKVWHHAGNSETWRLAVRPDLFYGGQRIKNIALADVPGDGVVQLADVAVKDPHSFDPLHPTWTLEGKRIDNDEWETVSDQNNRLYIAPTGSWVALKTTKPAAGTNAPGTDLTVTYNAFRATYWQYLGTQATTCTVVGHGRCVHSVPVSDLGYAPPDGAVDGYVCMKRRYDVNTPTVNGSGFIDGMAHSVASASGVSRFTPLCMQYGCCDKYEAAETSNELYKPFSMQDQRSVHELVGCVNQRLQRIVPRTPGFGAWQAQRVNHPSIMWHMGYVALATPNGVEHEVSVFRGMGLWGTGYYTYEDDSGNTFLDLVQGGMDGVKAGAWVVGLGNKLIDTDGGWTAVSGYNPKRDPVSPGATVSERELERIGAAVEKDSGALQADVGQAHSSVAVAAQNVVIPNVETASVVADKEFIRAGGAFIRKAGGGGGVVRLQRLRQAAKSEVSLGSRKVASVTNLGGGLVLWAFVSVQHIYSLINDGSSIGDSYDQKWTWDGGGGYPILPEDGHRIDCFYEQNKLAGSRMAGAWAGDTARVNGRDFVVKYTDAHGGADAGSWGADTYKNYDYSVPAQWRPADANLKFTDGAGNDYYGTATLVSVTDTITSTALTLLESDVRPAAIPAGKYWWDGSALFVGTAVSLQIVYTVADPMDTTEPPPSPSSFTEYVTVPADIEMLTEIASADWTGSDVQTVTVDGAAPLPGYSVDTSGTYVVFTFALLDAARGAAISLEFTGVAPPAPLDRYCVTYDYTTFGRNQDVAVVFDDADGFAASVLPGDDVEFLKSAAVSLPGWGLEWTAYGTDNWQAVSGAVIHAGDGDAVIPESWFSGKPDNVCFRATGVELMDHRGIFPASLWNKIGAWFAADKWVRCTVGASRGGSYSKETKCEKTWYLDQVPVTECPLGTYYLGDEATYESSASYNSFTVDFEPNTATSCTGTAVLSLDISGSFGAPLPLAFLPDGTVILEAKAEITATNLTRYYLSNFFAAKNCAGEDIVPGDGSPADTTVENVSYAVVGFTSPDTFEVIGSATGAANGIKVVDVTGIIQTMYDARGNGTYYGYGLAFIPDGAGSGSLADMVPGPGAIRMHDYSGGCHTCEQYYFFAEVYKNYLFWDSASFGAIVVKVRYPSGEVERLVMYPQWPGMG